MSDTPDLPLRVTRTPEPVPPSAGGRRAPRRWRWLMLLPLVPVPVLLLSGAVIGMYFQPPGLRLVFDRTGLIPGAGSSAPIALPPEIDLPPAVVETIVPTDVMGLARLIPRGDVITVAPPYGAGDARIATLPVAEGDRVDQGQIIATLDNRPFLESALLTARAEVAVREAALVQTRAGVAASRDEAQAALDQARAAAVEAQAEFDRTRALSQRGVATQAALDVAEANRSQATLAVAKAEATLNRFAAGDAETQPDVIVASRNLDAARAALTRAEADLARAEVRAPIAGTILSVDTRPGERPPAAGILTMGDTGQMMAEVEVYQDRIARVAPGQPVELLAMAIGQTLHGRVSRIGLTVGRQGLLPDDIAANTDARVVEVEVELDPESSAVAARYTHLEVVARIQTAAAGFGAMGENASDPQAVSPVRMPADR
ncbi:HlyD family efflux transporter periplasmic adaptor subunit [uncultured Paracoccus sp.]|uniref:HlyD family efflux transporter periplasmic adaptor subunit n=1 Tax=uncultured Paracoccus sp. TaxID=189685 RepID=UPI002605BCD7|nr:HlyD family efflux transporter periplasmic adaptor subunit [uncultured Paracoccus sp.]